MKTNTIPSGSIVVGIDGSPSAARALSWAVDQARLEHRALTLVHAIAPTDDVWLDQAGVDHARLSDALCTEARSRLEEAREQVRAHAPDLDVHEVLEVCDARDLLPQVAHDAALLVVGSRGRGPVRSLLLGSVGVAVTRHAPCPVVVLRPHHQGQVRRGVLVGSDGTARSHHVLEFAYRQASFRDLPLTVVHCYRDARTPSMSTGFAPALVDVPVADVESERMLLTESVSGLAEKFPDVHVRLELVRGAPDDALVLGSRQMDLVVVGTRRRGPLSSLVHGSVAATVLEHAAGAVAVVPEPAED
jgi:nucleotide-binding universal stress UspA family protein